MSAVGTWVWSLDHDEPGAAWKEQETRRLTELALRAGFRGIDTANQRRHYHEPAVGEAIVAAVASGLVAREETVVLFNCANGNKYPLPDASRRLKLEGAEPAKL